MCVSVCVWAKYGHQINGMLLTGEEDESLLAHAQQLHVVVVVVVVVVVTIVVVLFTNLCTTPW